MRFFLQMLLIIAGAVFVIYSLFLAARTNFNLGVILPALVGLPLLAGGIFFRFLLAQSASGTWYFFRLLLVAGYALALLAFLVANVLIFSQLQRRPDPDAEAVVVLGAALYGDKVSATLAQRLDTALDFWQQNPDLPVVVCGGQGPDELIPEAEAMASYLLQRGLPGDKIIIEARSTSTRENLQFAREALQKLPDRAAAADSSDPSGTDSRISVVVVTSGYHLYRAVKIAEQCELAASGVGAPTLWYLLPADLMRETLAIARLHILGY